MNWISQFPNDSLITHGVIKRRCGKTIERINTYIHPFSHISGVADLFIKIFNLSDFQLNSASFKVPTHNNFISRIVSRVLRIWLLQTHY